MQAISKMKKMILSALLLTLAIVLARFLSIKTPILTISFSFVPIVLSAIWLGPKYSVLISGLADIIGAILFPFGEFFIGFTISAVLAGLIYGLILHKKEKEIKNKELVIRLIISNILVTLLINTLLNTIWLMIMYQKAFIVLISARITKEILMIPIQVTTIFVLMQILKPITKRYLYEESRG